MKRLTLAALLALTAAPLMPAFADAKEPPRCEQPSGRPAPDRQGQRPDCPPPPREGRSEHRPAPGDRPAPRDDRRAEERAELGAVWRSGQTYKGRGERVDHKRVELPAPPRGQHWIRDGERYLLVSDDSGIIRSVIARALR